MKLLVVLILLPASLATAAPAGGFLKKSDDWFRDAEGRKTTSCVLSWQSRAGSWPKNTDTTRKQFLMSLENPSPRVIRAVNGGVAWFKSAKITGIHLVKTDGDRKIIRDASAPPLWARFYEIETNQPFCGGRDGVEKGSLAEIEAERRNGYAWYGNWGESVAREFAKWTHATRSADK